jgi:hypothetical protein
VTKTGKQPKDFKKGDAVVMVDMTEIGHWHGEDHATHIGNGLREGDVGTVERVAGSLYADSAIQIKWDTKKQAWWYNCNRIKLVREQRAEEDAGLPDKLETIII